MFSSYNQRIIHVVVQISPAGNAISDYKLVSSFLNDHPFQHLFLFFIRSSFLLEIISSSCEQHYQISQIKNKIFQILVIYMKCHTGFHTKIQYTRTLSKNYVSKRKFDRKNQQAGVLDNQRWSEILKRMHTVRTLNIYRV